MRHHTADMIQRLPDGAVIQFKLRAEFAAEGTHPSALQWEEFGWVREHGDWFSLELREKGIDFPVGLFAIEPMSENHWINEYDYRVVRTP
jgi:hypothetical protein